MSSLLSTRSVLVLTAVCVAVTASPFARVPLAATSEVHVVASDPSTTVSLFDDGPSEPSDEEFFSDLEVLEDPSLATQRATGLTNGELALVIVFLILLFPVGIILLIVFLVT